MLRDGITGDWYDLPHNSKMLQEANPVVKTIVDVLGAELEY